MKLAAKNLAYGYPGRQIGSDVTLELGAGEVLCLLGPNGSGKTTFFKTLLGEDLHALLALRLAETMDALAEEAATRDPARFRTLVLGRAGVGGVYDTGRRLKAWILGRRFDAAHGNDRR